MKKDLNYIQPDHKKLRALRIGALVAVVGCISMVGAYLRVGGGQTATISDGLPTSSPSSTSSPHEAARPKAISENAIESFTQAVNDESALYAEQETGRIFSVRLSTLKTDTLSSQKKEGFLGASWAPHAKKYIYEAQTPAGARFHLSDYASEQPLNIPAIISSIAVAPDGRSIVFAALSEGTPAVFRSDINGENPQKLLTTRAEDIELSWATNDTIAMKSRRPDRVGTDLTLINSRGDISAVLSNRENLEYTWSPDGSLLLYSYFTSKEGVALWYRNLKTGLDIPVGLPTSAKKCAWHATGDSITCGVPQNSSLSGNAPAQQSSTIDTIVSLNLITGDQVEHYVGSRAALIGVLNPVISSSEKYFVFKNVFDRRLYLLPL
jgi:Tol biopolymer transport system component